MPRLFISHASADRQFVNEELEGLLFALGFDVWYSVEDIKSGEQWERAIRLGLEASDWFILVMSADASKSEWVKDEIAWAFNYRPNRIIPIMARECNPVNFHLRLPRIQFIDFRHKRKKAREELIKVLVQKEYGVGSLAGAVKTLIKCPSKEILTVVKAETDESGMKLKLVGTNERANDFFARRKGTSIVGIDTSELLNTLSQWMEPGDFDRFLKDQERMGRAVSSGEEIYAIVPIKINNTHPIERFRGRNFLPISIAYSYPEHTEGKTVDYFLILYLDLDDIHKTISFVSESSKT
jgi:hypothetical protein